MASVCELTQPRWPRWKPSSCGWSAKTKARAAASAAAASQRLHFMQRPRVSRAAGSVLRSDGGPRRFVRNRRAGAARELEESLGEPLRDRPGRDRALATDRLAVEGSHRHDARARARQKGLVGAEE